MDGTGFLLRFLCLAIVFKGIAGVVGSFLSMLTHAQSFVLDPGRSLELDCDFYSESYNMFNNPVVWRKTQEQERAEVNIMGNILPPFLATGRFLVTFSTHHHQRFRLRLTITDISLEDSGNYTCDVRGTRGNILGSVTHSLIVRAPLQLLFLTTGNDSTRFSSVSVSTSGFLTPPTPSVPDDLPFIEGVPQTLRCVCLGGNPPPELTFYRNDVVVSAAYTGFHATMIRDGAEELGLRRFKYSTERWTDGLDLEREDDGTIFGCRAVVDAYTRVLETAVRVVVNHRPVVRCLPSSAELKDRDVYLTCEVRSRPSLLSLYWDEASASSSSPSENDTASPPAAAAKRPSEPYSMLVTMRNDEVIETKFLLHRVTQHSFRNYTLIAENAIGRTITHLELTQKVTPTESLKILELRHRLDARRDGGKTRSSSDHFEYRFATSSAPTLHIPYFIGASLLASRILWSAIWYAIDLRKNATTTSLAKMAASTATQRRHLEQYCEECSSCDEKLADCVIKRTRISGMKVLHRCVLLSISNVQPQR